MRILQLVQQLGVHWTRAEQERQLFALCVHVQAALRSRHGDTYTTPDVSLVPAACVDDAKEILRAALLFEGQRHQSRV